MERHSLTPESAEVAVLPLRIPEVLRRAWTEPFSIKSDFSRTHAETVAAAASLGFLTTRLSLMEFGRRWVLTPAGLAHYFQSQGLDE